MATNIDLTPYTDTIYQVWLVEPAGAKYLYRDHVGYAAALRWAGMWNEQPPADALPGATFVAVKATTAYTTLEA